jgi:hypothetical protein
MKYIVIIVVACVLLSAHPFKECYTKENKVAAVSEKDLDQAIRYANDKDYVALQKLMDSGAVILMKKRMKVFVVKVHITKVEFRLPGDTNVLWTVVEGIDC